MTGSDYSVWEGDALKDSSWVTIMRDPTAFTITVRYVRIENTRFGKEYLLRIKNSKSRGDNRPDPSTDPIALLCSECMPLFENLAPQKSIQGLTVKDLCKSPTYSLELVGVAGELDVRIECAEHVSYAPSYDISPIPTTDLPASCKGVPRVQTSDVLIAPTPDNSPGDTRTVQGKVNTADGKVRYFKPRVSIREAAFKREIEILGRINEAGLSSDEARVSNLVGIVVSEEEAVGMLIKWIPPSTMGGHLLSEGLWGEYEMHKKWYGQVTATVKKLHSHGIVWGDVNPMNIAIDDALNAWVIDFGGLNNPEFVDDDKMETSEGDWQGVKRIFEEWLPNQKFK